MYLLIMGKVVLTNKMYCCDDYLYEELGVIDGGGTDKEDLQTLLRVRNSGTGRDHGVLLVTTSTKLV